MQAEGTAGQENGDEQPRRATLRLDALPPGMARPVFKSVVRSAACAASRELAHALFLDKRG